MKKLLFLSALLIFACSPPSDWEGGWIGEGGVGDGGVGDTNLNTDIPSIVYGTQEWTVENACPITYRDGTPIPEVHLTQSG